MHARRLPLAAVAPRPLVRTTALAIALASVVAACSDDHPSLASRTSTTIGRAPNDGSSVDDGSDGDGPSDTRPPGSVVPRGLRSVALADFGDCDSYLSHVRGEATARVGPYGLDMYGGAMWFGRGGFAVEEAVALDASAAEAAPAGAAPAATVPASSQRTYAGGDDSSVVGTNVQEVGIDEPDIVKTDGRRIVTLADNILSVVDITTGQPVLAGQLTLDQSGWGAQMFLVGDRAILVTNSGLWGPIPVDPAASIDQAPAATEPVVVEPTATEPPATEPATSQPPATEPPATEPPITEPPITEAPITEPPVIEPVYTGPAAEVIEIDLSQPSDMRVVSNLRLEGQYLSARLIGTRLLLVTSSMPTMLPWQYAESIDDEQRSADANQQLVASTNLADWLPDYALVGANSSITGHLASCEQIGRPDEFAGFDVVSVLDLDLAAGLEAGFEARSTAAVLASGGHVYASHDRLYVATTRWVPQEIVVEQNDAALVSWSEDYATELHAFAISPGAPAAYVASGAIEGSLLNQFALDEHEGYLRAFATDGSPWNEQDLSETRLVVLQEQGDQLVEVGSVGGLGRGEALYSARLIGDRGFAVTFRQTDPFYVLDLSDPTNPQVTGELKIPGFSTYLHPVGEHRVLGVGQAATEDGQVTGMKLSLFDVSDPTAPAEISTWTVDEATSSAGYDHHAFQMIGSNAIVPVQSYDGLINDAVVFDIGDTIAERGRITHQAPVGEPTSDCRQLTADDVSESSELFWYTQDGYSQILMCGANQQGGYGNWMCERVPVDQLQNWFGNPDATVAELTAIAGDELDRVELCWSPGPDYLRTIQRSVGVDGVLWTISAGMIQGHDLASLDQIGELALR